MNMYYWRDIEAFFKSLNARRRVVEFAQLRFDELTEGGDRISGSHLGVVFADNVRARDFRAFYATQHARK